MQRTEIIDIAQSQLGLCLFLTASQCQACIRKLDCHARGRHTMHTGPAVRSQGKKEDGEREGKEIYRTLCSLTSPNIVAVIMFPKVW